MAAPIRLLSQPPLFFRQFRHVPLAEPFSVPVQTLPFLLATQAPHVWAPCIRPKPILLPDTFAVHNNVAQLDHVSAQSNKAYCLQAF